MLKMRRRNFHLGGSRAVTLPGGIQIGEESTMAGNRLLILDPTGNISEDSLLEFLTEKVEPLFWEWWKERKPKQVAAEEGRSYVPQEGGPSQAKPVKPAEPTVVIPQPGFVGIICQRCDGHITWDLNFSLAGYCPHCGDYIQLTI